MCNGGKEEGKDRSQSQETAKEKRDNIFPTLAAKRFRHLPAMRSKMLPSLLHTLLTETQHSDNHLGLPVLSINVGSFSYA